MKKIMLLLLIIPFLFMGAGEYKSFGGKRNIRCIIDTSGDSTIHNLDTTFSLWKLEGYDSHSSQIVITGIRSLDSSSFTDSILETDSVRLVLGSRNGYLSYPLDSGTYSGVPCTLITTTHIDSLLLDEMYLQFIVRDSSTTVSDSIFNFRYQLHYQVTLK